MDAQRLDALVAHLDGAVVVVTVAVGDERNGCLVGFHSQASIDPPRYAVWLSKANRTWRLAQEAEHLAVHLLGEHQHDLAELFGGETGDDVDKLVHTTWHAGPDGVPLLVGCDMGFVGRITERHDIGGDHTCVVLDPVGGWTVDRPSPSPLRLSHVGDIDPGHPA